MGADYPTAADHAPAPAPAARAALGMQRHPAPQSWGHEQGEGETGTGHGLESSRNSLRTFLIIARCKFPQHHGHTMHSPGVISPHVLGDSNTVLSLSLTCVGSQRKDPDTPFPSETSRSESLQ